MTTTSKPNTIIKFFILVTILSIPFFALGTFVDLTKYIPIKLPISALIFITPMLAAIILTRKNGEKGDLKLLLKRILDFNIIKNKYWLLIAILFIPTIMLLSYLLMLYLNLEIPKPQLTLIDTFLFALIFFIGAIGEEVGWTGYLTDPLQDHLGALNAALVLGTVWAVWHIIPYIQTNRTATWILWQCLGTVALRIIIVWIYNNTNKSLFAVIACHTTINISEYSFPNHGSHYDPFYSGILLTLAAVIISIFDFTKNARPEFSIPAKLKLQ